MLPEYQAPLEHQACPKRSSAVDAHNEKSIVCPCKAGNYFWIMLSRRINNGRGGCVSAYYNLCLRGILYHGILYHGIFYTVIRQVPTPLAII